MTPLHGTQGTFLLFVYGTLKRNGIRHAALGTSRYRGEARTPPRYTLLDLGEYPGLVECPGEGQSVQGELYEVDRGRIDLLDSVEGAPVWFALRRVQLEGCSAEAWAYFYQGDVGESECVASGRWANAPGKGGRAVSTEEAFLADIRERPHDDTPRLIFADWLEDNGDPDRADFIRLLIRTASWLDEGARGLRDQAGTLLVRNWRRWVGPLEEGLGLSHYEPWLTAMPSQAAVCHFPRGFIAHLTLAAPRFPRVAEALLRLVPLTGLSFRHGQGAVDQLAAQPELQWVRRLSFIDYYSSPLGLPDAVALAQSPHLVRLRQLSLFRNNVGDAGARALAEAHWAGNLHALDLTENGLSPRGVRCLAESSRLANLRHLALGLNSVGDDGAAALARASWLPGLETLSIDRAGVSPRGVALLRECAPFTRLCHDAPS